jgi:subtilisin-like proprotein convertase family protein
MMRRTIVLLSTMAVGLLMASGVALAATQTVKQTFTNPQDIHIAGQFTVGAASPYPSEITVSGFNEGSIRDVNLKLKGFGHDYPDDVGVLLVGPQGQKVLVMSDVGSSFPVAGVRLVLDDEAANSLPDFTFDPDSLTSGRYKPTQGPNAERNPVPADFFSPAPPGPYGKTLSEFDGTNPNGTWKLYVLDDTQLHAGKIGAWSLRIKARVTV